MTISLEKLEPQTKATVELLMDFVRGSEFSGKSFVAGGFVRDSLMGNPSKDIDVTVAMEDGGIKMARAFSKATGAPAPVIFERFGTAMVPMNGVEFEGVDLTGMDVEFVTTRTETYSEEDGRKPEVSFGTIEQDVERRDFTVNSMLFDLSTGELVDLMGGQADIERGIIRSPMDPSVILREDALRILRAVRFASRYDWPIEEKLEKAIRENSDRLDTISRERVKEELEKMTKRPGKAQATLLLQELGLIDIVFPVLQPVHLVNEAEASGSLAMLVAMIGFANAATPEQVGREMHGLKASNPERKQAQTLLEAMQMFDRALLGGQEPLETAARRSGSMAAAKGVEAPLAAWMGKWLTLPSEFGQQPPVFFDGFALQKMFEKKPGAWVGEAVSLQREMWFENPEVTREEVESVLNSSFG